jgi:hypothetical protein
MQTKFRLVRNDNDQWWYEHYYGEYAGWREVTSRQDSQEEATKLFEGHVDMLKKLHRARVETIEKEFMLDL